MFNGGEYLTEEKHEEEPINEVDISDEERFRIGVENSMFENQPGTYIQSVEEANKFQQQQIEDQQQQQQIEDQQQHQQQIEDQRQQQQQQQQIEDKHLQQQQQQIEKQRQQQQQIERQQKQIERQQMNINENKERRWTILGKKLLPSYSDLYYKNQMEEKINELIQKQLRAESNGNKEKTDIELLKLIKELIDKSAKKPKKKSAKKPKKKSAKKPKKKSAKKSKKKSAKKSKKKSKKK